MAVSHPPKDTMRHVRTAGTTHHEEHLVRRLAQETGTPEHEARDAYERERERLESYARVPNYLGVIAARHAREALRKRR